MTPKNQPKNSLKKLKAACESATSEGKVMTTKPDLLLPGTNSYNRAIDEVAEEVDRAREMFPDLHSPHEGWAVIREEVDELWDEVKCKGPSRAAM